MTTPTDASKPTLLEGVESPRKPIRVEAGLCACTAIRPGASAVRSVIASIFASLSCSAPNTAMEDGTSCTETFDRLVAVTTTSSSAVVCASAAGIKPVTIAQTTARVMGTTEQKGTFLVWKMGADIRSYLFFIDRENGGLDPEIIIYIIYDKTIF